MPDPFQSGANKDGKVSLQNPTTFVYTCDQTEADIGPLGVVQPGALTVSGNEITDVLRALGIEGDGLSDDSSFGIWEASENLIDNGGFETDTAGWATDGTNTFERSTVQAKFGDASLKATWKVASDLSWSYGRFPITVAAAGTFSASAWVWIPSDWDGTNIKLTVSNFAGATGTLEANADASKRDQWQRIEVPGVGIVDGDKFGEIAIRNVTTEPSDDKFIYIDGVQLEEKSTATPYIETDGATASRSAARVQVSVAGLFTETQGWAAFRVRLPWAADDAPTLPTFLDWKDGANDRLYCYYSDSGDKYRITRIDGGASTTLSSGVATHAAGDFATLIFGWTATALSISINGAAFTTTTNTNIPTIAATLADIGSVAGAQHFDGDVLWAAFGAGTLSDADAATIDGFGDTDTALAGFPGTCTAVWHADDATMIIATPEIRTAAWFKFPLDSLDLLGLVIDSVQLRLNVTGASNPSGQNKFSVIPYGGSLVDDSAASVGATVSIGIQNDNGLDPNMKTISHTIDANTTVVLVAIGVPDDRDFTSVTWNGVAMTPVDNYYANWSGAHRMGVYYATNDLSGTHDVVVTMATGGRFGATVLNLIRANAAAPFGTPVETSGASVTSIVSDSVPGDLILDFVIAMGGSILTVGAGQTPIDGRGGGDDNGIAGSSRFGVSSKTGPTTMGWSMNASSNWAHIAIRVNTATVAATGGGQADPSVDYCELQYMRCLEGASIYLDDAEFLDAVTGLRFLTLGGDIATDIVAAKVAGSDFAIALAIEPQLPFVDDNTMDMEGIEAGGTLEARLFVNFTTVGLSGLMGGSRQRGEITDTQGARKAHIV